jgi:hypothetical protein
MRPQSRGAFRARAVAGIALESEEGAGKAGAGRTHGPPANKKQAASPQVQPSHPAFPAQWFYGLYVISPVTMLGCHRHRWNRFHQLSACIGAPGPHDFAVRTNAVRPRNHCGSAMCVHRIPLPTFVTIAKRPSSRPRDARKGACDLPDGASTIAATCWHDGQIEHGVHARTARRAKSGALENCRRHSGAMRSIEPGISRFPDVQLHI